METTIQYALSNKKKGFQIGNRLILPFKCQFIKVMADSDIITEFVGNDDVQIHQSPKNTSIYFTERGQLRSMINSYKVVKIIVCEEDDDLSVADNHIKLVCQMKGQHEVSVEVPSDDMLFIE
tara:strand:- start:134 stop:499 length:366 start_codon:yes stop_codon:yes gene_type:complete